MCLTLALLKSVEDTPVLKGFFPSFDYFFFCLLYFYPSFETFFV